MSGAPAQAPAPTVAGTYGDGEAATEAQRRMPTPDLTPAPGGVPTPTAGPAPAGGGDRMAQAMQMLGRMAPGQPLGAPTQRPDEPFTAGLAQGPGPGPEVLRPGDRATQTLRLLADYSDDPGLVELAELAQRMAR
jgi:hypothetical protein